MGGGRGGGPEPTGSGRGFSTASLVPDWTTVRPSDAPPEQASTWVADQVLVTPKAEERLAPWEIWHHLGGWNDEGDTYESQEFDFEQELNRFWADVVGPDEHLRQTILSSLAAIKPEWKSVTISSDGKVTVHHSNGSTKTLEPPAAS